jgi:hypothetical protein
MFHNDMIRYLTSSIPYVNGTPHIGHALECIQVDTLLRYYRARGETIRGQFGSDDNSLKNVRAAQAAGEEVEAYVARHSEAFKALQPLLNLSFDDFMRTREDRHIRGAQKLWSMMKAEDIYQQTYEGLYCVGNAIVRDTTNSKSYRLRTSGGALDFESSGAPVIYSVWSAAAFGGTQQNYLNLQSSSQTAYAYGNWNFRAGNTGVLSGSGNPVLSILGAGSVSNIGVGSTSPYANLTIHANAFDTIRSTLFAIGSSTGSATTTLFSISNTGAITTNYATGCIQSTNGLLSSTGSACGGSGAYPFGLAGNATSTLTQFNAGLTAYASSTIGNGLSNGGQRGSVC